MRKSDLFGHSAAMDAIKKFVNHPMFIEIKDAFVCGSPTQGRETEANAIILNHGKIAGAIHVFNELENLVRTKPKPEKSEKTPYGEQDPDLRDA